MAIGTITMILANVGLSIFNNWAGSRQNKQIAEKREEFERAAREGQRERMLQLMREGQQLTLELEEQKHKERLSELNDQFDNLIKELAYSAAIEHWPLKTLPIVMKNQALGNLLANQEEKVALHCILTSSNCREFNDYVLPKVESALEAYCNVHWSTLTGSPVLFYSGAWKSNDVPTGTQVDSMRAALSNLPTLLITPFFRPQDHKLVFQAHVWGVGYNNSDQFTIPVIEPTEFQRDYTDELGWLAEDGLIEEAVEDLAPYLQCLIGYIADTYFWSAFGSVPQLPRMLTDGTINTDGMKYLVDDTREYYDTLILREQTRNKELPFDDGHLLGLITGTESLWNESKTTKTKEECLLININKLTLHDYHNIVELVTQKTINTYNMNIIRKIIELFRSFGFSKEADEIEDLSNHYTQENTFEANNSNDEMLTNNQNSSDDSKSVEFDEDILKSTDIVSLEKLGDNGLALYRLGEIFEFSFNTDPNSEKSNLFYKKSVDQGCVLAKFKQSYEKKDFTSITKDDVSTIFSMGSEQACIFKSMCFYHGIHKEKSLENAMDEVEKIEDSKHPLVPYWAAQIVKNEYGTEQKDLVIELLEKSANLNYVQAQVDLMFLYEDGKYVKERPDLAFEYAQKASLQGDDEALFRLGLYYLKGYYTRQNKTKAKDLIQMAASRGNEDAIDIIKKINS